MITIFRVVLLFQRHMGVCGKKADDVFSWILRKGRHSAIWLCGSPPLHQEAERFSLKQNNMATSQEPQLSGLGAGVILLTTSGTYYFVHHVERYKTVICFIEQQHEIVPPLDPGY
ncbi:uncharacterized protein LOC125529897 [Triticum urartu]|uniref:uncharacterized protein LOC125529897 n=1 Tax=Triticum urartu TaxID=4572 RepID=UPI00204319B2|nr:uncharacterized protein LOC125529897 [Triticum urartu]